MDIIRLLRFFFLTRSNQVYRLPQALGPHIELDSWSNPFLARDLQNIEVYIRLLSLIGIVLHFPALPHHVNILSYVL